MKHPTYLDLLILPDARGNRVPRPAGPLREFHVSREARLFYGFDDDLFTSTGNVIFPNFQAARRFAQKINEKRDLLRFPELAAYAHELNALGLFDEMVHYLIDLYRQRVDPRVLEEAETFLREKLGDEAFDTLLLRFVEAFPPKDVFKGRITPEQYLQGSSEGIPHRQLILEELLLLWLENENPAAEKYRELFDDAPLEAHPAYRPFIDALHTFFRQKPPAGSHQESLIDLLEAPIHKAPESLPEQLNYLLEYAQPLLTPDWQVKILKELDLAREETRPRPPGPGPGEPELIVPEFPRLAQTLWKASAGQEILLEGEEAYTPDEDWMPQVVLLSKHVLVWLDQLTRFYARPITRLDEIPDEELDRLAAYGFTGLWLIGVWERSPASRKIKHLRGNTDAEASAYAIYDYVIARRLGGEPAYEDLKKRCQERGIRLACDMVPNHTGLDAVWVAEHPDWYMATDTPPFPSYSYTGPNLSSHPHIGIWIEDHYWDATDAAVVFKREDFRTEDIRYIYHGNDGTSIPWNDTAQLNHLKKDVREALIQTILDIARKFPIIRFDAAMTLTKYHYQRLWFPEPGTAGAIPSRAEFSMTREEFDRHMPREFWREVVDRITEEAPDTLLIAEAFWLMEGYFVRTLGMHRVYNSAFMNMLKREENAKFLKLIQHTLEFDPEILKRYVNYMSNPDEDPAVVQFGKGDKYFGVCTLLVTMPGLPMFAHGQIEGFAEKYGMEFARAYWNETPDEALIQRHKREIFPLMKKRTLFADVAHFRLYPLIQGADVTDPHVIAYTNRTGNERALIIFHNRFASTRGNLHTSVPFRDKTTDTLQTSTLAEELELSRDEDTFTIFRERNSGLEYIYRNAHLHEFGLPLTLHAYEYRVYLDFEEVKDLDGTYAELHRQLAGRGVPSIKEALRHIPYIPLHDAFQACWNERVFTLFLRSSLDEASPIAQELIRSLIALLKEGAILLETPPPDIPPTFKEEVAAFIQKLYTEIPDAPSSWAPSPEFGAFLEEELRHRSFYRAAMWGWYLFHTLKHYLLPEASAAECLATADEWLLTRKMQEALPPTLFSETDQTRLINLVRALVVIDAYLQQTEEPPPAADVALKHLLQQPEIHALLNIHRYHGILWFSQEGFAGMLTGMALLLRLHAPPTASSWLQHLDTWYAASRESSYQLEAWLKAVHESTLTSKAKPSQQKATQEKNDA